MEWDLPRSIFWLLNRSWGVILLNHIPLLGLEPFNAYRLSPIISYTEGYSLCTFIILLYPSVDLFV